MFYVKRNIACGTFRGLGNVGLSCFWRFEKGGAVYSRVG